MANNDAAITRKQELGSAWILRRALKDNMRYDSWEDIMRDPKFDELGGKKGIYPEVDKEWLQTFYLQQKKMLIEFSNPKFTEFNREYGFMEYITKLVKSRYGIGKKDTWDPADIWCIKDERKVITDINKLINDDRLETVNELNAVLRTLFKDRIVVGVSLKKVSNKQAMYEEVNVESTDFPSFDDLNYTISDLGINLNVKRDTSSFATQDSYVNVAASEDGKKVFYKFQIKTSSPSTFGNLKFEPTLSSAAKAKLGQAPIDMARTLFKEYGLKFSNNNSDYPKSYSEYIKEEAKFKKMFKAIQGEVDTVVKTETAFTNNARIIFMKDPVTANSKMMQLHFLYELTRLPKQKMNNLMTELVFLAQKKGEKFGPFGKLY